MRLDCPRCGAQYEIPDEALGAAGREVECSTCGHAWLQMPDNGKPHLSRALDPDVLDILREEADRERTLRAGDMIREIPNQAPVERADPPAPTKAMLPQVYHDEAVEGPGAPDPDEDEWPVMTVTEPDAAPRPHAAPAPAGHPRHAPARLAPDLPHRNDPLEARLGPVDPLRAAKTAAPVAPSPAVPSPAASPAAPSPAVPSPAVPSPAVPSPEAAPVPDDASEARKRFARTTPATPLVLPQPGPLAATLEAPVDAPAPKNRAVPAATLPTARKPQPIPSPADIQRHTRPPEEHYDSRRAYHQGFAAALTVLALLTVAYLVAPVAGPDSAMGEMRATIDDGRTALYDQVTGLLERVSARAD